MLLNESALKQRIYSVYRAMITRAKPKLWKSGKRKGTVRIPGVDKLPFDKDQLWEHALNQVLPTGMPCPYCMEIGRKDYNVIDLTNLVFDHKVPLGRGGTWALSNLEAVCADCNNQKGKLTYDGFISTMQSIEDLPDAKDRSHLHSCLRSHGVSGRMRGFFGKPKTVPAEVVAEVNSLEF